VESGKSFEVSSGGGEGGGSDRPEIE
jgi:hypothetical protein